LDGLFEEGRKGEKEKRRKGEKEKRANSSFPRQVFYSGISIGCGLNVRHPMGQAAFVGRHYPEGHKRAQGRLPTTTNAFLEYTDDI
jgi:hypothetical protein